MHDSLRKARSLIASAAALGFLTAPALAEDREFAWSTTLTGTSDYMFRGLSLNGEDPAYQQSIDASYGIFYAGLWGSMVEGAAEPVELDWYAGVKPVLGPVTFDLGVVYYTYFWADEPSDLDYVELKLGAEFSPFTNFTLKPVFWWVPDQKNSPSQYTIEGTAAYKLHDIGIFTPTVSALVGYTEADQDGWYGTTDNYTYWNAGLALSVEKFTFDFRYWDTDLDSAAGDPYFGLDDSRFVFTAIITLP